MADVDSTLQALQGGLSPQAIPAAASDIDSWQQQLQGSSDPELQGIASDLSELKRHLSGPMPDGKSIGAILSRLGSATIAVAPKAGGATQAKLEQLGNLLSQAGQKLGG